MIAPSDVEEVSSCLGCYHVLDFFSNFLEENNLGYPVRPFADFFSIFNSFLLLLVFRLIKESDRTNTDGALSNLGSDPLALGKRL